MIISELIARADYYGRPLMSLLPPHVLTKLYSTGRKYFLDAFFSANFNYIHIPDSLAVQCGSLTFRSPIFNAAGMFKNAEGYEQCYALGAGAYLAGTTTSLPREGNNKNGINHPFCPYPHSGAASNWLGLPNQGHAAVAKKIAQLPRYTNFPIGISVSADPGMAPEQAVPLLIDGIHRYNDAGVDFIELNESCPNTETIVHHHKTLDPDLIHRLENIAKHCIDLPHHTTPIFLKFSNDIDKEQLFALIHIMHELGFAGINIGNTSIKYQQLENHIHKKDIKNFRYFYQTFGGGTSGTMLNVPSLDLCSHALEVLPDNAQMTIIRTGGIFSAKDIIASKQKGIPLQQWYTGFFDEFAHKGNNVYSSLYSQL